MEVFVKRMYELQSVGRLYNTGHWSYVVQVCDATADAIKYESWLTKKDTLFLVVILNVYGIK